MMNWVYVGILVKAELNLPYFQALQQNSPVKWKTIWYEYGETRTQPSSKKRQIEQLRDGFSAGEEEEVVRA